MTDKPDLRPLKSFSAAVSGLVAAVAPSLVCVHSRRSLSSGFVWKPGLVVTADEALAEEGEVAVMFAGGKRVAPAAAVGPRDLDLPLTPRKAEVLALLAEGESNKCIARRLGISVHTAKFQVGQVIDKLDATGRTDAVAHATRLGVIQL